MFIRLISLTGKINPEFDHLSLPPFLPLWSKSPWCPPRINSKSLLIGTLLLSFRQYNLFFPTAAWAILLEWRWDSVNPLLHGFSSHLKTKVPGLLTSHSPHVRSATHSALLTIPQTCRASYQLGFPLSPWPYAWPTSSFHDYLCSSNTSS